MAADRIARLVAAKLGRRALLLPVLPFGLSPHHMGFPGTITLAPETVIQLCFDVARSLDRQGIKTIVFVNGHNGNSAVLQVAATKIRYDLGMRAAVAFYFAQGVGPGARTRAHPAFRPRLRSGDQRPDAPRRGLRPG